MTASVACRIDAPSAPHGLRVLALPVPAQPGPPEATRNAARQQARAALAAALAEVLRCAPEALDIGNQRGQPPRARWRGPVTPPAGLDHVGLSVSHERGLCLLALLPGGAVGVDVVAHDTAPAPEEMHRLARLYLGPKTAAALDWKAPTDIVSIAFMRTWAGHEAALKCLGQSLIEWHPALEERLRALRTARVELPAWAGGHTAAVAWRSRHGWESCRLEDALNS